MKNVIILDDGDIPEKEVFRKILKANRYSAFGELIVEKSTNIPLLQAADVGVWVLQAYHRLSSNRTDAHAVKVRHLHAKLMSITKQIVL